MLACALCNEDCESVIFRNNLFRIILVDDPKYLGYLRLILNTHVKEMSDLSFDDAMLVMASIIKIEAVIRKVYCPTKVNLASLGNVVPHLHWHIIPRYCNDMHYPNTIWGDIINSKYVPNSNLYTLEPELINQLNKVLSS